MYRVIIYFIGGTMFETIMDNEKAVEDFKDKLENKELKDNNYFIRTLTNEGFNVSNINCYKIIKVQGGNHENIRYSDNG